MDAFFCCSFFPFVRDSRTLANSNTAKQKKEESRFEEYPSLCFKIVSLALRSRLTSSSLEVRKVPQRDRSMAFTFFPFPFSITALAVGVCPTDIAWRQFTTGKYMLPLSFFLFPQRCGPRGTGAELLGNAKLHRSRKKSKEKTCSPHRFFVFVCIMLATISRKRERTKKKKCSISMV